MSGKGDKPRNCFSKQFKDNYESINWKKSERVFKDSPAEDKREEKKRK